MGITTQERARRSVETLRRRISSHIALSIRARRDELGMSQARLSVLSGVHATMICNIEGGDTANPSIAVALSLAHALNCPLSTLIGVELSQAGIAAALNGRTR